MYYIAFLQALKNIFDHPDRGQSSAQRLLQLLGGELSFRILATDSAWNEPALLACFHDRLNLEIKLELACKDAGLDFKGCVELTIKLDQHLRGQGQR